MEDKMMRIPILMVERTLFGNLRITILWKATRLGMGASIIPMTKTAIIRIKRMTNANVKMIGCRLFSDVRLL